MKFKDFLKAKKGKELIEIMILFPVMLFLIIYTVLNVTCYIISSEVQDTTVDYARSAVTQRTYYKALCAIADKMEENDYYSTVTQITITNDDIVTTMEFSNNEVANTYFKNLIFKNQTSGATAFNINQSDRLKTNYEIMEKNWVNGAYISITTLKGIAPLINSVSQITLYNASEKKEYKLDYGMSGAIYCSTTSVIIA